MLILPKLLICEELLVKFINLHFFYNYMLKKINKFWDKIEPSVFIIFTLIFFLLISGAIFIYFKDAKVFNNYLLNLSTLIIFFLAVYLFIISLYYKIVEFTLMKPSLSEKEFHKLWKKEHKLSKELKKGMKTKKIPYNSKKFKEKWKEIEEIEEILNKKSIDFKSWFEFFIFSIYFGSLEGLFLWSLKNSTKFLKESIKSFFSLKKVGIGFRWYKLKDKSYIIDSFIYPYKKLKK